MMFNILNKTGLFIMCLILSLIGVVFIDHNFQTIKGEFLSYILGFVLLYLGFKVFDEIEK
jgi:uncharacterized protein YacL